MKKTLALAILALAAGAASAVEVTGTVKYDYDKLESASPYLAGHRGTASLGFGFGTAGTVDAGVVTGQAVFGPNRLNTNGFDVGYSNGLKFGNFGIGGRLGFSQLNTGTLLGNSITADTTSIAANVSYAVAPNVSLVGGVEHLRIRLLDVSGIANRATVGFESPVTKNLSIKAVYARTRVDGENANGLTTAVSYKF